MGKKTACQAIHYNRGKYIEVNGSLTLKFTLLEPSAFPNFGGSGRSWCHLALSSQHLVVMTLAGLEAGSHVPLVPVGRVQLPRHTSFLLLDR